MGETRIGQGRDAAKKYLMDNPEVAEKLEAAGDSESVVNLEWAMEFLRK